MTRRRPIVLTLGAGAIAIIVVCLAASPFLHHEHSTAQPTVTGNHPSPPQLDEITTIATIAATRALTCHAPSPTSPSRSGKPRGWCGGFALTREETDCRAATRCQVELIGVFSSPDASTVIALTVAVQQDGNRWRVTAVSS